MIKRKQYLKALEVIDKYHRQSAKEISSKRVLIIDWINKHPQLSTRIYNALTNDSVYYENRKYSGMTYMDEINDKTFLRCRNVGKKALYEFKELIALEIPLIK